ncbi:MAG: NAD-dependent epimerase/dehydratase family protein [Alphaproteobacteria bacterium]
MTILLTGASGFVGSSVLRHLLAQDHFVRVFLRANSPLTNLTGLKDIEIVRGDLSDPASLRSATKDCSALYHVAADYRLWARNPQEIYLNNVEGTRNLMRAALAAGISRIVYTSSVAVLGLNKDGTPADENTPVQLSDMIGDYKRSKYMAEEVVRNMVASEGLPAIIVNPSTPIGPRDIKPTPTGRMIVEAAAGRMPAFVNTGLNFAHVDDVAAGHLIAFAKGQIGRRYILGGENLSLRELLTTIAQMVGRSPPKIELNHNVVLPIAYAAEFWARLSGRKEEPFATVAGVKQARKLMYFKIDRAQRELGYAPRPAREAIQDAITWFIENKYLDRVPPGTID